MKISCEHKNPQFTKYKKIIPINRFNITVQNCIILTIKKLKIICFLDYPKIFIRILKFYLRKLVGEREHTFFKERYWECIENGLKAFWGFVLEWKVKWSAVNPHLSSNLEKGNNNSGQAMTQNLLSQVKHIPLNLPPHPPNLKGWVQGMEGAFGISDQLVTSNCFFF